MAISDYISIGVFALSVISAIVSIIVANYKNKNKVEDYKSKANRSEKIISLISEIIPKAVAFAEKSGTSGENKKLLALSQILINCMQNGIEYQGVSEDIDKTIEDLITFSKEVNVITAKKGV